MAKIECMHSETKEVTHNMDEIMKVSERFCATLYASNVRPGSSTERYNWVRKVPVVTKDEIEKTLNERKREKAAGDDEIIMDRLNNGGDIVLEKLSKLLLGCPRTLTVPL